MNVLIFGATGMVGQGVLRECLLDPGVKRVVIVGRRATGVEDVKLREIILSDVSDLTTAEPVLGDCDACLFCLGVSSAGMSEEKYTALTHDLTLDIAQTLVRLNPNVTRPLHPVLEKFFP